MHAREVSIRWGLSVVLLISLFFCSIPQMAHAETWSTPVDISAAGCDASLPKVSINASGQTVAVWVRGAETQSSNMTFGGAWSTPVVLRSSLEEIGYAPSVSINDSGRALAVWGGGFFNEPYSGAFSSTLVFSKQWSRPIGAYMGELDQDAQLAFNANGEAVIVMTNQMAPNQVKATKYSIGGNWDAPYLLSEQGYTACDGAAAINDQGSIAIAWKQTNGDNDQIYAHLSTYTGYWPNVWPKYGTTLSDFGQDAKTPKVALNNNDQVSIVWTRSNGTNQIIQGACTTIGDEWMSCGDFSAIGQDALEPQVAINDAGQVVFVWSRSDGLNTIIQSMTMTFGPGITPPVDLSASGQNATLPQVAINSAGQVVAVWVRSDGTNDRIQSATYNFGGSWTTPVDVSVAGQDASNPEVAINDEGQVVCVWSRSDGFNTIIQSSTTIAKPLPVTNLSGSQMSALSLAGATSYYNQLEWTPSISSNVTEYKINRNGVLIQTLPSTMPTLFRDMNQPQGVPQNYGIIAVSTGGGESDEVTLSVP